MKFGSNPIWQNAIGGIITAVVLGLFSLMMGFFTNPDSLVAGVETLAIRNPMVGKFDDPQIHDYIKTNFGIELTGALTKAFNRYPMAELAVLRIVNTGKTASKKVVIGFGANADRATPETYYRFHRSKKPQRSLFALSTRRSPTRSSTSGGR
jgi:hypothetical protein